MDLAGGLGGLGALLDGPGPALVLAVGQEGDQAQQSVGALDEPVQAGLLHSQLLQKHQLLLALQLGDVLLHLGADGQHLAVLRVGNGLHLLVVLVMLQIGEARLVGVGGVDHRLQGQQVGGGDQGRVVLVTGKGPGQIAPVQMLLQCGEHVHLMLELLVALQGFRGLLHPALDHLQIRHHQLHVDDVDVPPGVRAALHVNDVLVVKAADHVDDGVGLPDVGQELVAQALALAGALHQSGDVHEFDDRRGLLIRLIHLRQLVQPLVRHRYHAHVGVDGAERIVGALGAGVGDGVEQGRFAHIGQTHDS